MPAKKRPIARTKKKTAKRKTAKKKISEGPKRHKGLLPEKMDTKKLPEKQGKKVTRTPVRTRATTTKGVKLTKEQRDSLRRRTVRRLYIDAAMSSLEFTNAETKRLYIIPAFKKIQQVQLEIERLNRESIGDISKATQKALMNHQKEIFRQRRAGDISVASSIYNRGYDIQNAVTKLRQNLDNALRRPRVDLVTASAQLNKFFSTKINPRYGSGRLYWSLDGYRLKYGPKCVVLGPYECSMPIKISGRTGGDYDITIACKGDAWTTGTKNHPHVKNNRLCKGDADKYLRAFIGSGLYMDAAAIIEKTLNKYYSGSPWITFDEIYLQQVSDGIVEEQRTNQYKCERCGFTNTLSRRFTRCEICKKTVCFYNGCAKKCGPCDTVTCKLCEEHKPVRCGICDAKGCDTQKTGAKFTRCPHCCFYECEKCTKDRKVCRCCGYVYGKTVKKTLSKRKVAKKKTADEALQAALRQVEPNGRTYYSTTSTTETLPTHTYT
jgi:hypothetical protein